MAKLLPEPHRADIALLKLSRYPCPWCMPPVLPHRECPPRFLPGFHEPRQGCGGLSGTKRHRPLGKGTDLQVRGPDPTLPHAGCGLDSTGTVSSGGKRVNENMRHMGTPKTLTLDFTVS